MIPSIFPASRYKAITSPLDGISSSAVKLTYLPFFEERVVKDLPAKKAVSSPVFSRGTMNLLIGP